MTTKNITSDDIQSALVTLLPNDDNTSLQQKIILLSQLLIRFINKDISQKDIQAVIVKDDFAPLANALAGKEVSVGGKTINFGKNNRLGDVSIRDVVGGNINNITISIIINENLFRRLWRWIILLP